MRKRLAVTLSTLLIFSFVGAAELEGVSMPDKVTVDGYDLVLNGLGLREATMLKVDVYVGGLYLEQQATDGAAILASQQAKRIHMKFVRKAALEKITKAWDEGIEGNVDGGLKTYADQMQQLNGWMETMVNGDTMTFTAIPGEGLTVEVKGKKKGVITDEGFASDFWSIWLGPKPPNEGLKAGMLGAN